jgi:hypothetical protein
VSVEEILKGIRQIRIPDPGYPVEETAAAEFCSAFGGDAEIVRREPDKMKSEPGILYLSADSQEIRNLFQGKGINFPEEKEWFIFLIDDNRCCWLISSKPQFLFAGMTFLLESLKDKSTPKLANRFQEVSFPVEKSTFDLFLTQYARMLRSFNREKYIREYARLGFTHIEVNGLAGPFPAEEGVEGEFYPDFYTYCPALDQYVSSRLNEGVYPQSYLEANLDLLKKNANLALKYGLVPGLLCFEPRSVPELIFQKYPTLRGARVDHPFRSFKPRYNLSIVHPVVQQHYSELITSLLTEVPELEFLSIWSNDSGAGFEHTRSLYVGRNGGAYLIREWNDEEKIARSAAFNIINYFKVLKESASKINPRFRVVTRLESFYGEIDYLWPDLKENIDVEVNSLLSRGWEQNYFHPEYSDVPVLGSALHNNLLPGEKEPMEELRSRGSRSYFFHFFGSHGNHEPILGIPFPWLVYDKLKSALGLGVNALAHLGGIHPPDKVTYAVNQEVFRRFQFDSNLDIEKTIMTIASQYTDEDHAPDLMEGWRQVDRAVRFFMPMSIYSHYGVVWQRLFLRPLVPDIGKIAEKERAYYENFMCTSIHNPNKVDLSKDVLFDLISKEYAAKVLDKVDKNVWGPLKKATGLFRESMDRLKSLGDLEIHKVFEDQYYRARALKCLFETLRSTAVWIYAVHGYLETAIPEEKKNYRNILSEMIEREVNNTRELIRLWKEAPVEWMIVSGSVETPFIYAGNFPELLEKRITLMEKHKDDEPYIDPDYMFHVQGNPYEKL